MDHIPLVAAQTRWLVQHLEDCGVAPHDAQVGRLHQHMPGRWLCASCFAAQPPQLSQAGRCCFLNQPAPHAPAFCACVQEYQNRWVLRPAVRPACWQQLGSMVPAEDWEGVQRHVRQAIGAHTSSAGGSDGSGTAS